jgi:hypothetical protein
VKRSKSVIGMERIGCKAPSMCTNSCTLEAIEAMVGRFSAHKVSQDPETCDSHDDDDDIL